MLCTFLLLCFWCFNIDSFYTFWIYLFLVTDDFMLFIIIFDGFIVDFIVSA